MIWIKKVIYRIKWPQDHFMKIMLYNWGMSPEKISIKKQKETLARYLKEVKESKCKLSYGKYKWTFNFHDRSGTFVKGS